MGDGPSRVDAKKSPSIEIVDDDKALGYDTEGVSENEAAPDLELEGEDEGQKAKKRGLVSGKGKKKAEAEDLTLPVPGFSIGGGVTYSGRMVPSLRLEKGIVGGNESWSAVASYSSSTVAPFSHTESNPVPVGEKEVTTDVAGKVTSLDNAISMKTQRLTLGLKRDSMLNSWFGYSLGLNAGYKYTHSKQQVHDLSFAPGSAGVIGSYPESWMHEFIIQPNMGLVFRYNQSLLIRLDFSWADVPLAVGGSASLPKTTTLAGEGIPLVRQKHSLLEAKPDTQAAKQAQQMAGDTWPIFVGLQALYTF